MSEPERDDHGRFSRKVSDQDILKAFDFEATVEDPYLTVRELRQALAEHFDVDVTVEAVRYRLDGMTDDETIAKRDFGGAVAYRALVGPRLAPEIAEELAAEEFDRDEAIPLEEFESERGPE